MGFVENNTEFLDIKGLYTKYIKYWPTFVVFFIVCICIGGIYYKVAPPVVQVNANILIKEEDNSSLGGSQAMAAMQTMAIGGMMGIGGTSVNDELILLSSYSLMRNVGRDLALNVIYKKKHFPLDKDCYNDTPISIYTTTHMADTLRKVIKFKVDLNKSNECTIKAKIGWSTIGYVKSKEFPLKLITDVGTFYFDTTKYYLKNKPVQMDIFYTGYDLTTEVLQERLTVDQVSKKANVISMEITDQNINRGRDILNTLVSLYNRNGDEDKNNETSKMENFLDERICLMEGELDDVERNIEAYKRENNLTDIETEAKIILEKSQDFKEQLIEAEAQFTVIELVEQFMIKPENRYSLVPMNIGLSDRTVLQGLSDYNATLLQRVGLLQTTKAENPALKILNAQIDVMRDNMLETVRSIKSGYSRSRDDLLEQEKYFLARIGNMPMQEREFMTIKRQQMIKQELFLFLLQKKEENALTQALVKPKAKIVDSAYALSEPVSPKLIIVLTISTILSLFMSILVIIILRVLKIPRRI